MRLKYKPGAANIVANTLSRAPLPNEEGKGSVLCVQDQQEEPLLKSVGEQQRQDSVLRDLISYLQSKELTSDEQAAKQVLEMSKRGFVVIDGIMYYEEEGTGGCRLVVRTIYSRNYWMSNAMEFLLVTLHTRRCTKR